jgi:hypothetical protein
MLGVMLAASACLIAVACESSGGGGDCFPPEHGPNGPSCAGFDVGLSCPVGVTAWYSCVCTQGAGTDADGGASQAWVCVPAGSSNAGGGGSGGSGGSGTGGGGADGGA